jgi:hypothetical protein
VVAHRLELEVGVAGEQAEGEDGEGRRAARPREEDYEEEDGGDDAESYEGLGSAAGCGSRASWCVPVVDNGLLVSVVYWSIRRVGVGGGGKAHL